MTDQQPPWADAGFERGTAKNGGPIDDIYYLWTYPNDEQVYVQAYRSAEAGWFVYGEDQYVAQRVSAVASEHVAFGAASAMATWLAAVAREREGSAE